MAEEIKKTEPKVYEQGFNILNKEVPEMINGLRVSMYEAYIERFKKNIKDGKGLAEAVYNKVSEYVSKTMLGIKSTPEKLLGKLMYEDSIARILGFSKTMMNQQLEYIKEVRLEHLDGFARTISETATGAYNRLIGQWLTDMPKGDKVPFKRYIGDKLKKYGIDIVPKTFQQAIDYMPIVIRQTNDETSREELTDRLREDDEGLEGAVA